MIIIICGYIKIMVLISGYHANYLQLYKVSPVFLTTLLMLEIMGQFWQIVYMSNPLAFIFLAVVGWAAWRALMTIIVEKPNYFTVW